MVPPGHLGFSLPLLRAPPDRNSAQDRPVGPALGRGLRLPRTDGAAPELSDPRNGEEAPLELGPAREHARHHPGEELDPTERPISAPIGDLARLVRYHRPPGELPGELMNK